MKGLYKMKIQVIIQARMGSERLPGKVLLPLFGKPMLSHLIERVKKAKRVDKITIATSTDEKDDQVAFLADQLNIHVVRGDKDNVLLRFIQALDSDTTHVVRITADCPLVDHRIIDQIIEKGIEVDYTSNTLNRTYPRGFDIEMISREALLTAFREASTPYEKEHVTPFIYFHPQRFTFASVERKEDASLFRVTVDTKEDFELITKIFEALLTKNPDFSSEDVIDWLKHHPEEAKLNAEILQKEEKKGRVFIIAEAGSNFKMGSQKEDELMAKRLIFAAKEAGCDAVKFQTFRAETTYVPNAGLSGYLNQEITSLFKELEMSYDMLPFLAKTCDEAKIEFMSTPFSEADFLAVDPFVKRHKIASYENGYQALIELAAKSKKPTYISTGASTMEDIQFAVDTFHQAGGEDLTLLQCTAKYPAPIESLNLAVIPTLAKTFKVKMGLSDHSLPLSVAPIIAVSLGAQVIEKHFTLDRNLKGPDHKFALIPSELKALVEGIRETEIALGSFYKGVHKEEKELFLFAKRGIQAIQPIKKGETFNINKNIGILRPGCQKKGIHPKYLKEIESKKATREISLGEGIDFGDWE